ncbi:MAG: hypothetical protein QXH27_02495 [Candidatus Micrarchaeia archaeon]
MRVCIVALLLFAATAQATEWVLTTQADFLPGVFENTSAVAAGSVMLLGNEGWVQANNPIFDPATKAYYPTVLYDPNRFASHGAEAYYKMWYSDGSHVWLAVSEDGLNWSVVGQSTGLADANHPKAIYDPDGFGGSGVYYKIWYWDTTKLYTVEAIRYAESADGLNWVNDQPLTQDAGRPIITGVPSDWNRGSYGPSHIFYNSSGSDEMNHSNPSGNKYVMYFDGTDGGFEETGLAYSNNGINWSMCCKVLERGGGPWGNNGTWDSSYAYAWSVVRSPVGYELWYSGGQKASHEGIGHAVSSDGMNFTKDAANPIQSLARQPGAWNAERSYTPMVLYDANNFSGHGENSAYRMWFTGMASGNYAIGGARFTTSYPTSGAYLSPVFDAGARVSFVEINWSATFGNATAILLVTRTSDDGSNWSAWSAPHAYPLSPINASGRFIQFRAELSTSDPLLTPSLDEVRISYQGAPTGQSERAEGKSILTSKSSGIACSNP